MKIAVITPILQASSSQLQTRIASVRGQTHSATHFLVCPGDIKFARDTLPGVEWIQLPPCDNADTVRVIGAVFAFRQGFDAVAFLDIDNVYESHHLESLVNLQRSTKAEVCTSQLHGNESGDAEAVTVDCLLLTRSAFAAMAAFLLEAGGKESSSESPFWAAIKRANLVHSHLRLPTVSRRIEPIAATSIPSDEAESEIIPPDTKTSSTDAQPIQRWESTGADPSAMREPSNEVSPDSVSLCMIVKKNEEAKVAACIEPIARFFHDIVIVVDPGMSHYMEELRGRFGAKIVEFAWVDSFAAARNESIGHATGAWIFSMDSDERIDDENQAKLQGLFERLTEKNEAFFMAILSAPDDLVGCRFVADNIRLYQRKPEHTWIYRVHEQILPALRSSGARLVRSDVVIHHYGYTNAHLNAEKRARNLRLLRMDVEEFPCDSYTLFNLGNTLFDGGEWKEALKFLTRCLEYAPNDAASLAKVHMLLTKIYANLGQHDAALRICQKGKSQFPDDHDLWFEEGGIYLARGDLTAARRSFKQVLRVKAKGGYVGFNTDLIHHARHNLAVIYRNQGNNREAEYHWHRVIDAIPGFGPAWLGLTEIYLSQHRKEELASLKERLQKTQGTEHIIPGIQARIALKKNNWLQSTQLLEDAIARFPNATWLRLLLADILLQVANDTPSAEKQLRQILTLDPNHSVAGEKLRSIRKDSEGGR